MASPSHPILRALRLGGMAVAIGLAALPLAACSDDTRAVLHTSSGDHMFKVEVVDTPEGRAQGLMFRQELAPDAGMLFDFKESRHTSFWMMNTFIPLDIIFVDEAGEVKTVHANARPHDPTSIQSGAPVQFVLEIPGGRAAEIGLRPGDQLEHDRIRK